MLLHGIFLSLVILSALFNVSVLGFQHVFLLKKTIQTFIIIIIIIIIIIVIIIIIIIITKTSQ